MTRLNRWISSVRWILRRDRIERELDDEMRMFVEMSAADKVREGVPPAEARRLAVLELGGVEQAKERVRTSRHGAWLDDAGRDLQYAGRMFRRSPGFVVVIVLTLALGIGANTAIFSLIDALMLRSLPVPNPGELVQLSEQHPEGKGNVAFSYPLVRALAGQRDIFRALAGFSSASFNVQSGGSIQKVQGALVSGAFYDTLGLSPAIGRLLAPPDDEPGAPLVAVISDGYWTKHLQRDPAALGRALIINDLPVTIVGVSPPGFVGANVGSPADITMTLASLPRVNPPAAPLLGAGNSWLRVLARPAPGVSVREAEARLATVWPHTWEAAASPRWSASRREAFAAIRFQLVPGGTGWTFLRDLYRKPLAVLMAVVALLLLIACANVASLMLARASARQREIGVRLAMGAGRGRIVRQLLTESGLLSIAGAAFGMLVAWASGRVLVNTISTGPFQIVFDLTPNWRVLAFTGGVAMATAILFGLAPAFQATAGGPSPSLKEDARMSGSRARVMSSLVCVQVALSVLLLVGSGLFVRTLRNLQTLDAGFTREGVLLVPLPGNRTVPAQELLEDARRVAGVAAASIATHTPLSGATWSEAAVPKGQPLPEKETAHFIGVAPGLFDILQTPLVSGRSFTEADAGGAPPVAVVNEAFAARYFPERQPLGQYVTAMVRNEQKDLEIVGVVRNTRGAGLRRSPVPTIYLPYSQLPSTASANLVIRAHGSLTHTADALRAALQPKLPKAPVEIQPLSAQVDAAMVQERLMATLGGAFGGLALVLASVGIYGLLAYTVSRRFKELGIRLALGARQTRVIAMVLASAIRLLAIGVVLGVPAAWALSRWVKSMLFGLEPQDPSTVGGAILLLTSAALVAAFLPAWRASRVDPLTALRHE